MVLLDLKVSDQNADLLSSLREGLGKLVFAAGPLDRPDPSVASDAEDAAENAAATAHSKSDNPDDVMDELEAAEAQYDQTHSASGDTIASATYMQLHTRAEEQATCENEVVERAQA